jgi:hypothetical protein
MESPVTAEADRVAGSVVDGRYSDPEYSIQFLDSLIRTMAKVMIISRPWLPGPSFGEKETNLSHT